VPAVVSRSPYHPGGEIDRHPAGGGVEVNLGVPGLAIVTLTGEHDLATVERLHGGLRMAMTRTFAVVDVSACAFLDVITSRALREAHDAFAMRGGELVAVVPRAARIARLARLTRLHAEIGCFEDVAVAIRYLRACGAPLQ
jgi:anti-anti-sigma regulatory factor